MYADKATCRECDGDGAVEHGFIQGAYGGSHAECPADPVVVDCEHCLGEGECACDDRMDAASEAAYERRCEDFHGGAGPLPMAEQHRRAWDEKQALRR